MCRQSAAARRAAMPRTTLLLVLCALARATIIPDPPTLSERLETLYEKLESFSPKTTEPPVKLELHNPESLPTTQRIDKLYEKLDRLNSLTPDKYLSNEDEELLDALQEWGMLDDEIGIEKDLLRLKSDAEGDYDDEEFDMEDENDYAMDDGEDLELDDKEGTIAQTVKFPTPSALNRLERLGTAFSALSAVSDETQADAVRGRPQPIDQEQAMLSALDNIRATDDRPKILDDTSLTRQEQLGVVRAAREYLKSTVQRSKCLEPQPRWLSVRQMAPASDTLYRPTCVQLHRCAADTGCCHNEEQVCSPIEGHYVVIPLYLMRVQVKRPTVARMQFYNHTRCACVSRAETRQAVPRPPRRYRYQDQEKHDQDNLVQDNHQDKPSQDKQLEEPRVERQEEGVETTANANQGDWPTQEPKLDSETPAPPQLRRCTCPTLFLAQTADSGCVCVCDWINSQRRRDCLSLSRGREHFGLRDRVCVANGDCNPPTCEYGAYERNFGRCPLKRYRRLRFKPVKYLDRTLTGS